MIEKDLKIAQELEIVAEELERRGEFDLSTKVKKEQTKAKEVTIDYITSKCKCQSCPSYAECGGNLAFCYYGESKVPEIKKRACVCTTCPVKKRLKLPGRYHCISGKSPTFLRQLAPEKVK